MLCVWLQATWHYSLTGIAEAIRPLNLDHHIMEVEGHQPPGAQVALTPTLNLLPLAMSLADGSIEEFFATSASRVPTVPQNVLARTWPQPRSGSPSCLWNWSKSKGSPRT